MSKVKPDLIKRHKGEKRQVPQITIKVLIKKIWYNKTIDIDRLLFNIKTYDDYEISPEDFERAKAYL
jgi:hypothetical protein